jgi:uncharacterized protein
MISATKIFLDTGPLVAIVNRRDHYHHWATDQLAELEVDALISNSAVITEAYHLLNKINNGAGGLINLLEQEFILIQDPYPEERHFIHEQLRNYRNIRTSFADICLIAMANKEKGSSIFTIDSDFNIYRDSNGKPFKLITPY